MNKLRDYETKRALRKRISRLEEDKRHLCNEIDCLRTENSTLNHYKCRSAELLEQVNALLGERERVAYFPQASAGIERGA